MELLLEIILYLLVVLGLITVCFTFFNKYSVLNLVVNDKEYRKMYEENSYVRNKKEGQQIILNIKYRNIPIEEMEKVKESIEYGMYDNINDIVDKVKYIDLNGNIIKK